MPTKSRRYRDGPAAVVDTDRAHGAAASSPRASVDEALDLPRPNPEVIICDTGTDHSQHGYRQSQSEVGVLTIAVRVLIIATRVLTFAAWGEGSDNCNEGADKRINGAANNNTGAPDRVCQAAISRSVALMPVAVRSYEGCSGTPLSSR